jgi:hypothetical protein
METPKRVSPLSLLIEARHELRSHLALETTLMQRISELPEDNFCHHARESLAYGAGYAHTEFARNEAEDQWCHVFSAYFALQPRNKYLDEAVVRETNERVIKAALDWLDNDDMPVIDPDINQYTVEGLVAFVEGFAMTREYFESQEFSLPSDMAKSA